MTNRKISIVTIFLFCIIAASWTPKRAGMPRAGYNVTLNYTKLRLTRSQYNKLASEEQFKNGGDPSGAAGRSNLGKSVLVFQFAYLDEMYPYPTLRAFPMRSKDQHSVFGSSIDLQYESSKPLPDLSVCAPQVTGDMQIPFSELELLKKESNPGDPGRYQYFLFTPKFDDVTQHVYYEISVYPYTAPDLLPKSRFLNPSPPYGG